MGVSEHVRMRFEKFVRANLCALLSGCLITLTACDNTPTAPAACDENLKDVSQLIVVATDTMNSPAADIAVFGRDPSQSNTSPTPSWKLIKPPFSGVVGSAGLGWGNGFEAMQARGEAIKKEGDKRTPAGLYPVGATFGFEPQTGWPDHLTLRAGQHVCVDDLSSPHYGAIVSRQTAGNDTSAEDMANISLYKRGIVITYPQNRAKKSGSCIFFHIWQGAGQATVGCVASNETDIAELQDLTTRAKTAVVIWARSAKARLSRCLPGLPVETIGAAPGSR